MLCVSFKTIVSIGLSVMKKKETRKIILKSCKTFRLGDEMWVDVQILNHKKVGGGGEGRENAFCFILFCFVLWSLKCSYFNYLFWFSSSDAIQTQAGRRMGHTPEHCIITIWFKFIILKVGHFTFKINSSNNFSKQFYVKLYRVLIVSSWLITVILQWQNYTITLQ